MQDILAAVPAAVEGVPAPGAADLGEEVVAVPVVFPVVEGGEALERIYGGLGQGANLWLGV